MFQADLVQFVPPEFAEVEGVDVGADEAGAAVFEINYNAKTNKYYGK